MLPKVQKDVIAAINLTNVLYKFKCECHTRYEGKASQRLVDRMRQLVPLATRNSTDRCNSRCQPKQKFKANLAKPESKSDIGTHLMRSVECGNS